MSQKKKEYGFTIIEMVAAITIMVLLLTLMTLNFNASSKSRNLTLAASRIASDLHKMQSFALSSKLYNSSSPSKSWVFKVDMTVNKQIYTLGSYSNAIPPTGVLGDVENVTLPPNIYIKYIYMTPVYGTVTTSCASSSLVDFKVPYSRVFIGYTWTAGVYTCLGGNSGSSSIEVSDIIMQIVLSTTDNTLTKSIYINGTTGNISY